MPATKRPHGSTAINLNSWDEIFRRVRYPVTMFKK